MPVSNVSFSFHDLVALASSGAADTEVLDVRRTRGAGRQVVLASEQKSTIIRCAAVCGDDSAMQRVMSLIRNSLAQRIGDSAADTLVRRWADSPKLSDSVIYLGNLRELLKEVAKTDRSDTLLQGLKAAGVQSGEGLREMNAFGFSDLNTDVRAALSENGRSEAALRSFMGRAAELLDVHSFSPEGSAKQIGDLAMAAYEAGEYAKLFEAAGKPACTDIAQRLRAFVEQLNAQKTLLAEQAAGDAHLKVNLRPAMEARYKAAMDYLVKKIMADPTSPNAGRMKTLSTELASELYSLQHERISGGAADDKDLKRLQELPKKLCGRLAAVLLPAGASSRSVKALAGEMKEALNESFRQELSRMPWKPVVRQVPMFDAKGGMQMLTSAMTPSNQLGNGESMRLDGISGVTSADRASVHASNLWSSELTVRQPDGSSRTLFKGMRHGVHDAFGIKDPALRRQANISRVKEFYTAALHAQPALLQAALEGKTVKLPVVSTSLLGPNWFIKKEKTMLANQNAAWTDACTDGICELNIGGKTVKVEPKVITFNYAVDMWSQSFGLHAWRNTQAQNDEGLRQLIGSGADIDPQSHVGQFLATCPDEGLKSKVRQLADQIGSMRTSGAYKKWGSDPYAMPARIALLAYLTGAMPAYNCKSGKDRTGQMDVAVKTLAFQLDQGSLPNPQEPSTKESKLIMNKMAANSGNMEVQQYNTGLAGSKTAGWFSNPGGLKSQFSDDAFEYYKGLQEFAKS